MRKALALAAFIGCVWGANLALAKWGIVPFLGWHRLMVPAGVYFAGLSFGVRDVLQEFGGRRWVVVGIVTGAVVSYAVESSRTFAIASGVAFLASESFDAAIYTPLRERHWPTAVIASNTLGSAVDSLLFLTLAFSWTNARGGWVDLTVAKALMTLPALAVMAWVRRPRPATEVAPA